MPARSRRFAGPEIIGVAPVIAFTNVSTHYALIRWVAASHVSPSTQQLAIFIGIPGLATQVLEREVSPTDGLQLEVRWVVNPEESVWWSSNSAVASMVASLHGFRVLA